MSKKPQLVLIHGGMTFKNKKDYIHYLKTREISIDKSPSWFSHYLDETLGIQFQIIRLRMPRSEDAKYNEWKIHFERYIPFLKGRAILVGFSLGGIFLAKYLSENKLAKKAHSVYLVGAPFDDSLSTEDLAGGFKLKSNLSLILRNTEKVHLLFSKDDDVVPLAHAKKFAAKLGGIEPIIYKNKNGHFGVPRFPEIVRMIKENTKKA